MLTMIAAVLIAQVQPVPYSAVTFTDDFWAPRQKMNATAALDQNLSQCEITGRIANLEKAGQHGRETGGFQGLYFNDSDVFKAVEGAAYVYGTTKDDALKRRMNALVATIANAQQADGYLNSYFTIQKPAEKWTNLKDMHELYCAGHLIEAGIAHDEATGERTLLDVAIRLADHIDSTFGPAPKRAGVCGHPEIELALIRLGKYTSKPKYIDLARYFVNARGRTDGGRELYGEYAQDHAPLVEQRKVVGHAVRAMYLFSAATDLTAMDHDPAMTSALDSLWDNLTQRKMYVTGGIGNSSSNEGFTRDFDLPNDSAYAETCAGIGLVMWAQRMNLLHGDGRYADVMEQALYNAALSGLSQDGREFFYVNPMSSHGQHQRQPWYSCACCPPNILRLIASLGGYVATQDADTITVNLYANSTIRAAVGAKGPGGRDTSAPVRLEVQTKYPWEGKVTVRVKPQRSSSRFTLRLRVPEWAQGATATASFGTISSETKRGYIEITRAWGHDDEVVLDLPMNPRMLVADPRIAPARGQTAFARGPLIYCFESADLPKGTGFGTLAVNTARGVTAEWEARTLGGVHVLRVWGREVPAQTFEDAPYATLKSGGEAYLKAVPYFTWANRGTGDMRVWMPSSEAVAVASGGAGPAVSASHTWQADSTAALTDGSVPRRSSERETPRFSWWPRKGTEEWTRLEFATPREVSAARVFWYDDTAAGGGCAVPASWRLEYLEGAVWQPFEVVPGAAFGVLPDQFNEVRVKPVSTTAVRLVATLQEGKSAGIHEWEIDAKRP